MAIIAVTKDNFKEVINAQKLALIEFYAPWCTYCRRIAPAFKKVAEQYEDRMAIGQVNIDASPELAEAHRIELVPTLVVFENGKPVKDVVAPESKAQIEGMIQPYM